jgi:hypothetical protein
VEQFFRIPSLSMRGTPGDVRQSPQPPPRPDRLIRPASLLVDWRDQPPNCASWLRIEPRLGCSTIGGFTLARVMGIACNLSTQAVPPGSLRRPAHGAVGRLRFPADRVARHYRISAAALCNQSPQSVGRASSRLVPTVWATVRSPGTPATFAQSAACISKFLMRASSRLLPKMPSVQVN